MNSDLNDYRRLVDDYLVKSMLRWKGLVPEQLLSVMRGYLTGGKRLRPLLLMLCCDGFGGNAADIVQAAAAVEMYHNWTLIHDDIVDHDDLRRGKPTGHVIGRKEGSNAFGLSGEHAADYGTSVAILSGDLLHGLALETLGSMSSAYPTVIPWLTTRMSGWLGRELISGEQLDVEMSHMPFGKVSETLVQIMTTGKTGALLRFCMVAGTALGLNAIDDDRIVAMGRFGNLWGVSFQFQDDLLGIFGETEKLGKAVGSDIREGKRTLLAVRTLAGLSGSRRDRFLQLYGKDDVTPQDIDEVRALMRGSGAVESVQKSAEKILSEALLILQGVMPPSNEYKKLVDLSMDMLHREV